MGIISTCCKTQFPVNYCSVPSISTFAVYMFENINMNKVESKHLFKMLKNQVSITYTPMLTIHIGQENKILKGCL